MRLNDIRDWWKLRRFAANPWQIVWFRKRQRAGKTLTVRMRTGHRLHLRGGSHDHLVFREIYLKDQYRVSRHEAETWQCVVDLGANVGLFTSRVAEQAERVICYEPIPENFAQLRRNIEGLSNVAPVQEAVDGKTGMMRLHFPQANEATGQFAKYPQPEIHLPESFIEVPCITLDELFDRHRIESCDLLKIDVEGAEYDILYAASDRTYARILRIYGEYHIARPNAERSSIAALAAFLRSKRFDVEIVPQRNLADYGLFFATQPKRQAKP
ncbi:MAG: FkbM family methyltransferase [Planctomycetes bacterium]|nr:FkbM family methyltransferase [Planctomycetota bacterium]